MSSNLKLSPFARLVVAIAMITVAPATFAAPRFIASSEVHKGAVYAEVRIDFRCKVHYVDHEPAGKSDLLRIRIDPTTICTGAPPTVALTKEQLRPLAADDAWLDSIEYFGEAPGNEHLILAFTEDVRFDVRLSGTSDSIIVRVFGPTVESTPRTVSGAPDRPDGSHRVLPKDAVPKFVVNLQSATRRPATADLPTLQLASGTSLLIEEAQIDGQTWYRLQVGYFPSAEDAARALRQYRADYSGAWIGRASDDHLASEIQALPEDLPVESSAAESPDTARTAGNDEIAELMNEARRAMTAGELSRAVQIYTKVLQQPPNDFQRAAQEFLALARERNGQIAHAKAEYERYLEVYPDGEGAERVRQRLSALVASRSQAPAVDASGGAPAQRTARAANPWTLRTFA